jgi:transcriptional regulator with XRE-family HTH domain
MRRITKKSLALSLHAAGSTVEEIAQALDTSPSYIANVLAAAGKTPDYQDLYVSTAALNSYAKQLQGVLRFKDVEAARESVQRIDQMYRAFEQQRDRRGQHQAQLLALIGKNRAEGIGKYDEARIFADWLKAHLAVQPYDPEPPVRRPAEAEEAAHTADALSGTF